MSTANRARWAHTHSGASHYTALRTSDRARRPPRNAQRGTTMKLTRFGERAVTAARKIAAELHGAKVQQQRGRTALNTSVDGTECQPVCAERRPDGDLPPASRDGGIGGRAD